MRTITDQFKSIAKIALRNEVTLVRLLELLVEAEREVSDTEGKFPFYPGAPKPQDEPTPVELHETVKLKVDQDTEEFDALTEEDLSEPPTAPMHRLGVCFACGGRAGTHQSWCKFNNASPTYTP